MIMFMLGLESDNLTLIDVLSILRAVSKLLMNFRCCVLAIRRYSLSYRDVEELIKNGSRLTIPSICGSRLGVLS